MKQRVAIIGAGIAGLTLARELHARASVTLFEQSPEVGGRMATHDVAPFSFDHGTQYFTTRSRVFREFMKPWIAKGVVAEWAGKVVTLVPGKEPSPRLWFEPHFVGVPTMAHFCKALAEGLTVHTHVEVAPLGTRADGWALTDIHGTPLGMFDWVVSTAPPVHTAALMGTHMPGNAPLMQVHLQGCDALMVGFNRPWEGAWIGAKIEESPLGWVSINTTKPRRDEAVTSIVAHARNAWSDAHRDDADAAVQALLLRELAAATGIDCAKPDYVALHRWSYALVDMPSKPGPYCDAKQKLAAVGDWSVTSRIEEVWYAATDLAAKIA